MDGIDVPSTESKPDHKAEPANGIEYPPELGVITNSDGIPYVSLATDTLAHILNAMTKKLASEQDEEKREKYGVKIDAARKILALRKAARE
jgi:hypothetical protein